MIGLEGGYLVILLIFLGFSALFGLIMALIYYPKWAARAVKDTVTHGPKVAVKVAARTANMLNESPEMRQKAIDDVTGVTDQRRRQVEGDREIERARIRRRFEREKLLDRNGRTLKGGALQSRMEHMESFKVKWATARLIPLDVLNAEGTGSRDNSTENQGGGTQ